MARVSLDVDPHCVHFIPANAVAEIRATTVFGNKYVSLSSPEHPVAQRISSSDVISVASVTTEFTTVFETVTALNHLEIGRPMLIDYVWGRQVGELTTNP